MYVGSEASRPASEQSSQTFEALDRAHVLEFVVLTYSEEAR